MNMWLIFVIIVAVWIYSESNGSGGPGRKLKSLMKGGSAGKGARVAGALVVITLVAIGSYIAYNYSMTGSKGSPPGARARVSPGSGHGGHKGSGSGHGGHKGSGSGHGGHKGSGSGSGSGDKKCSPACSQKGGTCDLTQGTCKCNQGYSGTDCSTHKHLNRNYIAGITGCLATEVAKSDKSKIGSIAGDEGEKVTVKCNRGYTGGGIATCTRGKFNDVKCEECYTKSQKLYDNECSGFTKGVCSGTKACDKLNPTTQSKCNRHRPDGAEPSCTWTAKGTCSAECKTVWGQFYKQCSKDIKIETDKNTLCQPKPKLTPKLTPKPKPKPKPKPCKKGQFSKTGKEPGCKPCPSDHFSADDSNQCTRCKECKNTEKWTAKCSPTQDTKCEKMTKAEMKNCEKFAIRGDCDLQRLGNKIPYYCPASVACVDPDIDRDCSESERKASGCIGKTDTPFGAMKPKCSFRKPKDSAQYMIACEIGQGMPVPPHTQLRQPSTGWCRALGGKDPKKVHPRSLTGGGTLYFLVAPTHSREKWLVMAPALIHSIAT
jgi:hypothetical protein